jgi:hypothetical protein
MGNAALGQAVRGFADVWKRGFSGWEYKGKHKDLTEAYDQLLRYRDALENPPLLIVCGLERAGLIVYQGPHAEST